MFQVSILCFFVDFFLAPCTHIVSVCLFSKTQYPVYCKRSWKRINIQKKSWIWCISQKFDTGFNYFLKMLLSVKRLIVHIILVHIAHAQNKSFSRIYVCWEAELAIPVYCQAFSCSLQYSANISCTVSHLANIIILSFKFFLSIYDKEISP